MSFARQIQRRREAEHRRQRKPTRFVTRPEELVIESPAVGEYAERMKFLEPMSMTAKLVDPTGRVYYWRVTGLVETWSDGEMK